MSSITATNDKGEEVETWKCFLPKCKWTFDVSYGLDNDNNSRFWSRKFSLGVRGDEECSKHVRTHWQWQLVRYAWGRKFIAKMYGTKWKTKEEMK